MLPRAAPLLSLPLLCALASLRPALALHGDQHLSSPRTCPTAHGRGSDACVSPGVCTPPSAALHSAVATGPAPALQWDISGGFCGSFSLQQAAYADPLPPIPHPPPPIPGRWAQALRRRLDLAGQGAQGEHPPARPAHDAWRQHPEMREQSARMRLGGHAVSALSSSLPTSSSKASKTLLPRSNVKWTADHLRLKSVEWDYTQTSPQAPAWKAWVKSHLTKGQPVVFFPMCKGDPHQCYPGSCPNGGHCDHVEVMYGIWSNHSLSDPTAYPDDVIVHTADQDCFPYYRRMDSLEDDTSMEGKCVATRCCLRFLR